MKKATAVLSVKFKSTHQPEQLISICEADLEEFRNVPGLIQKYYLTEESTGAISGFYIFKTKMAREAFWSADLAKRIPLRYGVIPESLRVEQYDMAIVLNEAPVLA